MDSKQAYAAKFKDPRWQKFRLRIMERDCWACCQCGAEDKNLQVHHLFYQYGKDPWDYDPDLLQTLCEDCHGKETAKRKDLLQLLGRTLAECQVSWKDIEQLCLFLHRVARDDDVGDFIRRLRLLSEFPGFIELFDAAVATCHDDEGFAIFRTLVVGWKDADGNIELCVRAPAQAKQ